MDPDGTIEQDLKIQQPNDKVRLTFASITFSDGTTVRTEPLDVIVLVGPNNAGKSLALRELHEFVRGEPESKVITAVTKDVAGTAESFEGFVRENTRVELQNNGRSISIHGYGVNLGIGGGRIDSMWPDKLGDLGALFCLRILTEKRINDSDPIDAIDTLTESPTHPIHLLNDDIVEKRLSNYFRRAFGQDLILYRAGGRKATLLVGDQPTRTSEEDRVSNSYLKRLKDSTQLLNTQGDGMRSFASVILHLLAPSTPSILLLDEPEAFLHPPQARLLGEIIATDRSSRAQLFLATHSPDVLQGLIDVAPDHLKVLRLQRSGAVNRVKELDKGTIQRISRNPLMRYSSLLSGVFHERVVLCEGDGDCMFYHSLLDIPEVYGERHPDVLFVNSGGKHQMAAFAEALRSLGVPLDAIVDMDVLNDLGIFRGIVESLGGDWSSMERSYKAVKTAVEERRPLQSIQDAKRAIQRIIDTTPDTPDSLSQLRRDISEQFPSSSPWESIKSAGEQALPPGEAIRHFRVIRDLCKDIGLWIVSVGQMEGFCKSVGGHGPGWIQEVMGKYDLETASELKGARDFVHQIWTSKEDLAADHLDGLSSIPRKEN